MSGDGLNGDLCKTNSDCNNMPCVLSAGEDTFICNAEYDQALCCPDERVLVTRKYYPKGPKDQNRPSVQTYYSCERSINTQCTQPIPTPGPTPAEKCPAGGRERKWWCPPSNKEGK